jgi:hypothetical protein
LNASTSLLNGPSSKPTGVAVSGKILGDKTRLSLSYYLARNSSTVLWMPVPFTLYHCATDITTSILLSLWSLLFRPFPRRRLPHRRVPLPRTPHRQALVAMTPHRQASVPFAFPATYFLISCYMLRMTFVSLLLGLAKLGGLVLVENPFLERQPPGVPPEPAPDPHDFLPARTWGRGPAKRLLHLGLLAAIAASDATPTLSLTSEKALKQELCKYRGASGFVTRTSAIQPPA